MQKVTFFSLIIGVLSLFVGVLSFQGVRDNLIGGLGGIPLSEHKEMTEALKAAYATTGPSVAHKQLSFEQIKTGGHLKCVGQIATILNSEFTMEFDRWASSDAAPNFSGGFFQRRKEGNHVTGTITCADFVINSDLAFTFVLIVVSSLEKSEAQSLTNDLVERLRSHFGSEVWAPYIIRDYID